MGKETMNEELLKVPLEVLYKLLYKDYKNLLIEKGKNDSYIQELEDENYKLKHNYYNNIYNDSDELKQKIFEYKKDIIHTQSLKEIKSLKEDRDNFRNLYCKLLSSGNEGM